MGDVRILHITHVKPEFFTCSDPKRNFKGGLRIDIQYNNPSMSTGSYLIQTPKLRLPFGLAQTETADGGCSYSLPMSIDEHDNVGSIPHEFSEGIKKIDERIKEMACENSVTWFKKPMNMDIINELYNPSLKQNGDYSPIFKAKIAYYNQRMNCKFFNSSQQLVDASTITKNSQVITLLQPSNLWFLDRRFGLTWIAKQVQVFPHVNYNEFMISPTLADCTGEEADAEME